MVHHDTGYVQHLTCSYLVNIIWSHHWLVNDLGPGLQPIKESWLLRAEAQWSQFPQFPCHYCRKLALVKPCEPWVGTKAAFEFSFLGSVSCLIAPIGFNSPIEQTNKQFKWWTQVNTMTPLATSVLFPENSASPILSIQSHSPSPNRNSLCRTWMAMLCPDLSARTWGHAATRLKKFAPWGNLPPRKWCIRLYTIHISKGFLLLPAGKLGAQSVCPFDALCLSKVYMTQGLRWFFCLCRVCMACKDN